MFNSMQPGDVNTTHFLFSPVNSGGNVDYILIRLVKIFHRPKSLIVSAMEGLDSTLTLDHRVSLTGASCIAAGAFCPEHRGVVVGAAWLLALEFRPGSREFNPLRLHRYQ